MPTYEYRCKTCGHEFEIVQAFTDDGLTVCPECSGNLKKVFGNVGITFKGSGFYKTDSRSSDSTGSTREANHSDRKTGTESSKKSDSSPSGGSSDSSSSSGASQKSDAPAKSSDSGSSGSSSSSGSSASSTPS